jgi:hypothetical protein
MDQLWKQLRDKYRFVGISLQAAKLDGYLQQYPLPFDVAILEDYQQDEWSSYGFGATPSLYLVYSGKIQRAWGGALAAEVKADIESILKVKLPGLPLGKEDPKP